MGILNALSTAVTGLSAQSYALENISGNIANSQTVGYKRVDTSFVDLSPDSPVRHEVAGSVVSFSQLTDTIQGSLKSTGVATNMAVNGDGHFTVQRRDYVLRRLAVASARACGRPTLRNRNRDERGHEQRYRHLVPR